MLKRLVLIFIAALLVFSSWDCSYLQNRIQQSQAEKVIDSYLAGYRDAQPDKVRNTLINPPRISDKLLKEDLEGRRKGEGKIIKWHLRQIEIDPVQTQALATVEVESSKQISLLLFDLRKKETRKRFKILAIEPIDEIKFSEINYSMSTRLFFVAGGLRGAHHW